VKFRALIAWWWNADRHDLLIASLRKLTPEESRVLLDWVRVEAPSRSEKKATALGEIEAAINATQE
jgi:hypothetical protein